MCQEHDKLRRCDMVSRIMSSCPKMPMFSSPAMGISCLHGKENFVDMLKLRTLGLRISPDDPGEPSENYRAILRGR